MIKRLTLVFVAATLVLTGCSAIHSGTITGKDHDPAHYYTTMQCSMYNSKGLCTMHIPVQHYVDDSYSFDLKQGEETGWVHVSESEYNQYQIGDFYGKADTH